MNGVGMGDRLLHVMVQHAPAQRGRAQPGAAPPLPPPLQAMPHHLYQQQQQQHHLQQQQQQAIASLGLVNASALANLQTASAGLIPNGGAGGMIPPPTVRLGGGQYHTASYPGLSGQQQGNGFGSMQW